MVEQAEPCVTPAVFDMDIGSDPDDTCVALMVLAGQGRFHPALLLTNDETATAGRARFLARLVAAAESEVPVAAGLPSQRRRAACLVEEAGLCPGVARFELDGVAAGLPSQRRRAGCLVEEAGLCPDVARFEPDGVAALIGVLEAHASVDYFGLGALTNLDAALVARPDLAARVRLWQMGPALLGAYRRELPQYNARLDPGAFQRALVRVRAPSLVLSHSTWGRYGEGSRQRLGVYPDDPLAGALREKSALAALFVRHLEAWAQSGKPCSIMHDPLTVLSASMPELVDLTDVELVVSDDGWASLGERACEDLRALAPERTGMIAACLSGPRAQTAGTTIAARMSLGIDDEAVRRGIVEALLGSEGAAVSSAWSEHNRARAE